MSAPTIFLSAGETSGDLYLSRVAAALREARPELRLVGVVGSHGRDAGVEPWARTEDLQVMGFGEVLGQLPRLLRLASALERRARDGGVDLFLPVDYPGFHVRLAGRLRRHGIPVLDFIPPKTWSWGSWRLGGLARGVDRCAVIFPFEVEHYRRAGIDAEFVGHPLVDAHAARLDDTTRARSGLLLAPGSRRQELARLVPVLVEALARLNRAGVDVGPVRVSAAPGVDLNLLAPLREAGVEIVEGPLLDLLQSSRAAVVCSGTATVEAALSSTPHVIVYRTSALNYGIARSLASVEHIGMANIVLGRRAFPELLQGDCTGPSIADAVSALFLDRDGAAGDQHRAARELRERLGRPGCFRRVAASALEMLDARGRS